MLYFGKHSFTLLLSSLKILKHKPARTYQDQPSILYGTLWIAELQIESLRNSHSKSFDLRCLE